MAPAHSRLLISCLACFFIASCDSSDDDAARIVLGTANSISEVTGGLQYLKPFTVQVTDGNGNAISGASVDLSYTTTVYRKGSYQAVDSDIPVDGEPDVWAQITTISCNAEDTNQNDIEEAGEDLDGDGILEPTNSATIAAHPTLTPTIISGTRLVTDTNGLGYFALIYPKTEAGWVSILIQARTGVSGTEYQELFPFRLSLLNEDLEDITIAPPSGSTASRYGTVADCTDPM